jgi:hypothetical protein
MENRHEEKGKGEMANDRSGKMNRQGRQGEEHGRAECKVQSEKCKVRSEGRR